MQNDLPRITRADTVRTNVKSCVEDHDVTCSAAHVEGQHMLASSFGISHVSSLWLFTEHLASPLIAAEMNFSESMMLGEKQTAFGCKFSIF